MRIAERRYICVRLAHRIQRPVVQLRLDKGAVSHWPPPDHHAIPDASICRHDAAQWHGCWPLGVTEKVYTVTEALGLFHAEVNPQLTHRSRKSFDCQKKHLRRSDRIPIVHVEIRCPAARR